MAAREHILKIISLIFFLGSMVGCDEAGPFVNYKMKREVLPNGLRVFLVEDRSVSLINYTTMIKVGSLWEKEGKTGIAHLFEHMMFQGTAQNRGKGFTEAVESRGGSTNAYTKRDMTVYYSDIASEHLELLVNLESDRLVNLELNEKVLANEKKVVIEERRMRFDNDYYSHQIAALYEIMFAGHPYGRDVIGYEDDINGLTLKDCQDFYKKYYKPANTVLVISGDIDTDKTLDLVKKKYGSIPKVELEKTQFPDSKPVGVEIRKTITRPVESDVLLVGYRIPSQEHDDLLPLFLLKMALFDINSSVAKEVLINEKKVALAVASELQGQWQPSEFVIRMVMGGGTPAERGLFELDKIIDQTLTEPFTSNELARVKNWVELFLMSSAMSGRGVASLLSFGEFYDGDYRISLSQAADFKNVTAADLMKVSRIYLRPENRGIVIMKAGVVQ